MADYGKYYDKCMLCPRGCGVNRNIGMIGACHATSQVLLSRAALHFWEEPCISGNNGSGTVFFCGCNLGCVYCQNGLISHGGYGRPVSTERLSEIFFELRDKGAENINLVTPTHYVPSIIEALDIAKSNGFTLPVVYNSGGYDSVDTLKMLEGYIDVYLPDFKYMSGVLSARYSSAPDYFERAAAAVEEMVRQCGNPVFDEKGMITRGVIVRHLVLPECGRDSKNIISYLHSKYGNRIYISIMRQYTPMPGISGKYPELDCRISDREYERILDFAEKCGVVNGFTQEGDSVGESFIPPFDFAGV